LNVLLDFLNAYRDDYAACFGTWVHPWDPSIQV
jgi:hypothetical protein